MPLPADWNGRLEAWWRSAKRPQNCPVCGCNAAGWQARELSADPPAVGLVCPGCGHATVFLWEVLEKGQQV
jgi:hypothetical protein